MMFISLQTISSIKKTLTPHQVWANSSKFIGDTRRKKFYIPLAYKVMERFLRAGFALKEDIIKVQHNCKATGFWVKKSKEYNFLLIMHEHIFVFYKP